MVTMKHVFVGLGMCVGLAAGAQPSAGLLGPARLEVSEPSAEELVDRAKAAPSLMFRAADLPAMRRRLAEDSDAKAWWEGFRKTLDANVAKGVKVPPCGAQWYHYYSCRKCGRPLKPKSPTLHVCPACGETHTGWPYDDAALFAKQNRAADAALDCALVYALDGSPAFAATARAYLTGLASAYPGYLPHDNKGPGPLDLSKRNRPRCGRAFPQGTARGPAPSFRTFRPMAMWMCVTTQPITWISPSAKGRTSCSSPWRSALPARTAPPPSSTTAR